MNQKNKVLSYVYIVLCALCIVGSVFVLLQDIELPVNKIVAVDAIVCTCFAMFYAVKGYKKEAAPYFKTYMILAFLFFQGCACTNGVNYGADYKIASHFLILTNTLLASIFLCLALAKDMGKDLSYKLLCIAQVLTFVGVVLAFVFRPGVAFGGSVENTVSVVRGMSKFVVVSIACLMTKFKYEDKAVRGTK